MNQVQIGDRSTKDNGNCMEHFGLNQFNVDSLLFSNCVNVAKLIGYEQVRFRFKAALQKTIVSLCGSIQFTFYVSAVKCHILQLVFLDTEQTSEQIQNGIYSKLSIWDNTVLKANVQVGETENSFINKDAVFTSCKKYTIVQY